MKLPNLVVALVAVTVTLVNGVALNHRSKRQNYDALLQNKAFVESQINCVLRRGQCDRIGNRIKILVPEVVKTKECKSCTEDEKGNVQKVADHVKSNYPKEWNEIREQYNEDEDDEEDDDEDEEENDAEVETETSTGSESVDTGVDAANGTSQVGSSSSSSSSSTTVADKDGSQADQNVLVATVTKNQTLETDSNKKVETSPEPKKSK